MLGVVLAVRQSASGLECFCPYLAGGQRVIFTGCLQGPFQEAVALTHPPLAHPELLQCSRQLQRLLYLAALQQPAQSGPEVLMFSLQPLRPAPLFRTQQGRLSPFCEGEVILGVCITRLLQFSQGCQALQPILTNER